MSNTKRLWLEFAILTAATLAAVRLLALLNVFYPRWASLGATLLCLFFFWVPIALIAVRKLPTADYGFDLRNWRSDIGRGLLISMAILPAFAVGYWLWWGVLLHRPIHPGLGAPLFIQIAVQLLAIAIPEEVFFRGYLQTLVAQAWPAKKPWPLVGVEGPAIVVVAAVFALSHLDRWAPTRLSVFFPGLLFGLLRARSKSLVQPVVVHTLANLTMVFLQGRG